MRSDCLPDMADSSKIDVDDSCETRRDVAIKKSNTRKSKKKKRIIIISFLS
jgi:hypothetical protein